MSFDDEAHRAVERAVRDSYGRLIAFLTARWGDVMAAEDALGDALLAALDQWPRHGVPDNPEAWLLVVARRREADRARRARVAAEALPRVAEVAELVAQLQRHPGADFPDERLQLLFMCAHPAIDPALRTPLLLQTVLGLSAETIGSAFLVKPATMGQRLVRAKRKIRDAGIPFAVPAAEELPSRLESVLEAIYAAYHTGWVDFGGIDGRSGDLALEAIWLARLVVDLLPDQPECLGLLALFLSCEARRPARVDAEGRLVPLSEQDTSRWDLDHINEVERLLRRAVAAEHHGRFQLEAAIQAAHNLGRLRGAVDWEAIALLYEGLVRHAATVGALVGRAAALARARGSKAGLRALERIPEKQCAAYQPYWALRAYLLRESGRPAQAREAYRRAIGLTDDPVLRAFLQQEMPPAADDRRGTP